MGSSSSKFKKYVQHGDEFAAMQIFQSSPELRKHLDPNLSYGENHNYNTALHYAAKHGMKHLLRTFLTDSGGNPNNRNGRKETVLHCACQLNQQAQPRSFSAHERRAACVALILQWRRVHLNSDQLEKVDLSAQDVDGNTALHSAARTGLRRCVELLLAYGAPLFIENNDDMTPCDVAMHNNQHDIAQLLESRMIFADSDIINEDELNEASPLDGQEEVYSGLRPQDLQEAKDQLLVETSDMLHIPLFTAEALLRDNEWSREKLLEKWMLDPVQCCLLAGVQAPASALQFAELNVDTSICSSPEAQDGVNGNGVNLQDVECKICLMPISLWQRPNIQMSCRHQFCATCWERYLTVKILEGDAHNIHCPDFQCDILVPIDVIEKLVSPEMVRRYLHFDIQAFVESNRSIKWCPVAACGRAVRLPEVEHTRNDGEGCSTVPATSHAVDCGNAHFFCWECLEEAHAPAGCNQWLEWHNKISTVRSEELKTASSESHNAANCLWLVTNSKPCPNCKSPIQKNEGCNHMKCFKCKHDFCWVCLEGWKKHSSATGGYFRCNRFEEVNKVNERQGTLITEASIRNTRVQELSRFYHFYTRFKNHLNSQRLEQPFLIGVRKKMEQLAKLLIKPQGVAEDELNDTITALTFIEDGVRELLKARRVLCGSYVYGYYLEDDGHNKAIFEFMQNELEETTERLSDIIARRYIITPKSVIISTTVLTRRKRHEFVRAVSKGLVPPETPPMLRRVRPTNFSELEMSEALPASWKSESGDQIGNYENNQENAEVNRTLAVSLVGECNSPDCNRPRARNPKTGATHNYCSLKCSRQADRNCNFYHVLPNSNYNMELVIALEMSRLQMIEDKIKKGHSGVIENVNTPGTSITQDNSTEDLGYGIDDQLKLAIQLSLQESTAAISKQLTGAGASINEHFPTEHTSISVQTIGTETTPTYTKTNEDITVDCFLKSLANQKIDFRSFTSGENDDNFFFNVSGNEDGRFQISDIHENGYNSFVDVDDVDIDVGLRRSHSTGDICIRRNGWGFSRGVRLEPEQLGYHLDSDQSSQYDEKCQPESRFQCSITPTTQSDSLKADMEVCGILTGPPTETPPKSLNPFASLKAKLCSSQISKGGYLSKMAVNKSIGLLSDSSDRRNSDGHSITQKKSRSSTFSKNQMKSTSKSTGFLLDTKKFKSNHLRIKIGKTFKRELETDSSNEYESETGIPKSPTLFISGVSICRTPEPKSPAISLFSKTNPNGRTSRSSSLTVCPSNTTCPNTQTQITITTTQSESPITSTTVSTQTSPYKPESKAKSASEPEREREMFRFTKSSTDGALSSVLHVQESNLSSDDFHEALFLLERSPKIRDSKRKKKSKKKDHSNDRVKEDASSAL